MEAPVKSAPRSRLVAANCRAVLNSLILGTDVEPLRKQTDHHAAVTAGRMRQLSGSGYLPIAETGLASAASKDVGGRADPRAKPADGRDDTMSRTCIGQQWPGRVQSLHRA